MDGLLAQGEKDVKLVGSIFQYFPPTWEVHVDGASNQKGAGVRLVLTSSEMVTIEMSLRLDFPATNNEAEYEALLEGIAMVLRMGGKSIKLFSDSRLAVGQVKGEFEAKDERMRDYLSQVKIMQMEFESFNLLHVPRSGNAHADSLATLATSSAQNLPRIILVKDLHRPSTTANVVQINQVRIGPSWMNPVMQFLKEDILPEEKIEANKIRKKATSYWLSKDSKLYRRWALFAVCSS